MAITSSFLKANGLLTTLGDAIDNTILISRDAAGTIQVNGGAVPVLGGQMVPAPICYARRRPMPIHGCSGRAGDGQALS